VRSRLPQQSCPALLGVEKTLAKNAVEIAAELEFAVEAGRTKRLIGHSRRVNGDERIAFRAAPQRSFQLLLLYRIDIGFQVIHGTLP
jgi:hypothetical protein